jgi:hypothetical protein
MRKTRDVHIRRALRAADELCCIADEGEAQSQDDGCCILYGVVRDCGYKIKGWANREKERHERTIRNDSKRKGDTSGKG